MSHPPQLQQNGYAGEETDGDDKRPDSAKNGDLEKLETTQEGEVLAQNADAAKREWIKTAPQSPRNWPLWRKCKLLHSSRLGFGASFGQDTCLKRTFLLPRRSQLLALAQIRFHLREKKASWINSVNWELLQKYH